MTEIADNAVFEVQTYTICQGWINCWMVDDFPQTFETIEEAQAELDEFFTDINYEIRTGNRAPDEGYSRDDYRICKVVRKAVEVNR